MPCAAAVGVDCAACTGSVPERWRVVVAVMIASTAGGAATAWADAPPAGALSQLPGQAACLATTNSDAPPDGTCTLFRTSATSGSCINCLGNAAISPDGLDVYLVDQGANTLVHMRRDPATGQIVQSLGPGGCISGSGLNGCARARGSRTASASKKGQPGLPTPRGAAISPDGRNVVSASGRTDAVLAFSRDPSTGALQQLSGRSGCIGVGISACARARAMQFNNRLLVSPEGANVYVEMSRSPASAVLRRAGDGSLHQLAGKAGCLSGSRSRAARSSAIRPRTRSRSRPTASRPTSPAATRTTSRSTPLRHRGARLQQLHAYQDTKPAACTTRASSSAEDEPRGSSLYLVEGVDDLVGYARRPTPQSTSCRPFGCGARPVPDPRGGGVDRLHARQPDRLLHPGHRQRERRRHHRLPPRRRRSLTPFAARLLSWPPSRRRARPRRTCA